MEAVSPSLPKEVFLTSAPSKLGSFSCLGSIFTLFDKEIGVFAAIPGSASHACPIHDLFVDAIPCCASHVLDLSAAHLHQTNSTTKYLLGLAIPFHILTPQQKNNFPDDFEMPPEADHHLP